MNTVFLETKMMPVCIPECGGLIHLIQSSNKEGGERWALEAKKVHNCVEYGKSKRRFLPNLNHIENIMEE